MWLWVENLIICLDYSVTSGGTRFMVNNFPRPDPLKCFNRIPELYITLVRSHVAQRRKTILVVTHRQWGKKVTNTVQTVQNGHIFNTRHHTLGCQRHASDRAKQLSSVNKIIQVRRVESCKDEACAYIAREFFFHQ